MQGNKEIIKAINAVLKLQLTGINQHFLHARICKNWGLHTLNQHEYQASIKQMKQADKLIERVLFLEGLPNLQDLGKLHIGEAVEEILQCNLILVNDILDCLREAISKAEVAQDYVSRELLNNILEEEEERHDWLSTELALLKDIGTENYHQSQM